MRKRRAGRGLSICRGTICIIVGSALSAIALLLVPSQSESAPKIGLRYRANTRGLHRFSQISPSRERYGIVRQQNVNQYVGSSSISHLLTSRPAQASILLHLTADKHLWAGGAGGGLGPHSTWRQHYVYVVRTAVVSERLRRPSRRRQQPRTPVSPWVGRAKRDEAEVIQAGNRKQGNASTPQLPPAALL